MYQLGRHRMWRRVGGLPVFLLLSVSLASCAVSFGDPHEKYKELMSGNVGRPIEKLRIWFGKPPEMLVASRRLPNGNIENEYRYIRSCRTFFEFDPKSRIVVNWRLEGPKTDCSHW